VLILHYLDWISHYRDREGHIPVNVPLILARDSTDLDRQLLLANYYLEVGNATELTFMAQRLEHLFGDNAQAMNHAALSYLKMARLQQSGESFEKAYRLDSNDVAILIGYAAYLYEVEDYQRAASLLERAVELNPESFLANNNLAVLYAELGRLEPAVGYLARAETLMASKSHERMVKRTRALLKNRAQTPTAP
jgi:tetratricopeptide (TPR) repeat protein